MSIGTIASPKVLNKQYAVASAKEIVIDNNTMQTYIADGATYSVIEFKIQKLISYLSNVVNVIIPEIGSRLDCIDKIDIMVELQNETVIGFQIKEGKYSSSSANTFSKKNNVGVLYVGYAYNPVVLLLHLSRFLKLDIREDVVNVCRLAKLYKGKLLPAKMLNLSNVQLEILTTLQLVQVRGRNIQFFK